MLADRMRMRRRRVEESGGGSNYFLFNSLDGWEHNGYLANGYSNWTDTAKIRNSNFFEFNGGTTISSGSTEGTALGYGLRIYFYDISKNALEYVESRFNYSISKSPLPLNAKYFRLVLTEVNFKPIPSINIVLDLNLYVEIE